MHGPWHDARPPPLQLVLCGRARHPLRLLLLLHPLHSAAPATLSSLALPKSSRPSPPSPHTITATHLRLLPPVCMPPPSPVLSTPPPPPLSGWRSPSLFQDHTRLDGLQAQAAQLRALHAAVLNNTAPLKNKIISPAKSRPPRCASPNRSAQDYPVFTPSYEEFVLGDRFQVENLRRNSIESEALRGAKYSQIVDGRGLDSSEQVGTDESRASSKAVADQGAADGSTKPLLWESSANLGAFAHHITSIHPIRGSTGQKVKPKIKSPEMKLLGDSRRRNKPLSEFLTEAARKKTASDKRKSSEAAEVAHNKTVSEASEAHRNKPAAPEVADCGGLSCDRCLPGSANSKVTVVPLMDSRDYTDIPPKDRNFAELAPPKSRTGNNPFKSWFFRAKKKPTIAVSKDASVPHSHSEAGKDFEMAMAMDCMELKISQANKKRDAALVEVSELRLAIGEMGKKVEDLEHYCQSLKHASEMSRRNVGENDLEGHEGGGNYVQKVEDQDPKRARVSGGAGNRFWPTKNEFYHAVTEARVGVKQFCRTAVQQIQEATDSRAAEKIDTILQAYNVRVAPRVSRSVRYHLEALISQAFYENFENIKFEKCGSHCILDPNQRVLAFYQTYLTLSKLGWNELLSKESSAYSESFDRFCNQKMNLVEAVLNWEGRWPDQLAQAFFIAARWVWLLHLIAFSFEPAATIFRVGSEAAFDPKYMEELPSDQSKKLDDLPQIRAMVMPGFFVRNEVIKCKVLCRQP